MKKISSKFQPKTSKVINSDRSNRPESVTQKEENNIPEGTEFWGERSRVWELIEGGSQVAN